MRRLPQLCQAAISAFPRALTQLCLWQPRNHREGSARLCRLPTWPVGPAPEGSLSCCVLHCLLPEISPTPCSRSSLSFPPADDWPSRAGTAILWEAMAVLATPAGPTAVQGDRCHQPQCFWPWDRGEPCRLLQHLPTLPWSSPALL